MGDNVRADSNDREIADIRRRVAEEMAVIQAAIERVEVALSPRALPRRDEEER